MPTEKPTFKGIVEEHAPFIRRTLAQLGVSARDLADVEQEVFRGIDRGLAAFDPTLSGNPETAVRGWLFGICERQAASHRRAELKRGEVLFANEDLDVAQAAPTVEDELIVQERKALLMQLLASIEPQRRAVVIAYELEGIAMADVAAALAIPVNTAWNRLRLAREDLRTAWKRLAKKQKVSGVAPLGLAELFGDAPWCSEDVVSRLASWLDHVRAGVRAAVEQAAQAAGSVPIGAAPVAVGGVIGAGAVMAALVLPPPKGPPPAALNTRSFPASTTPAAAEPPEEPAAPERPGPEEAPEGPQPATVDPPSPSPTVEALAAASSGVAPASPARGRAAADARLRSEAAQIEEAQLALERGDTAGVDRILSAHRRTFAEGKLADEAVVIRVRSLLLQGDDHEARDQVRSYLSTNPDSRSRSLLEKLVRDVK